MIDRPTDTVWNIRDKKYNTEETNMADNDKSI